MELLASAAILVFLAFAFTAFFGAPYVPSRRREIRQAFSELYALNKSDTVVDLGSGDGIVLRVAREYGATAVGYELSPPLVWISRLLARGDKKQSILNKSYWRADFPLRTTVVYAFSDGRDIKKLHDLVERQATKLGHSLTFITYGFEAPHKTPVKTYRAYFLYTVTPCGEPQA